MQRTYLALAGGALVATAAAGAVAGFGLTPRGQAGELFEAGPVDPGRYAVLGRPLGNGEWTLLVLAQGLSTSAVASGSSAPTAWWTPA